MFDKVHPSLLTFQSLLIVNVRLTVCQFLLVFYILAYFIKSENVKMFYLVFRFVPNLKKQKNELIIRSSQPKHCWGFTGKMFTRQQQQQRQQQQPEWTLSRLQERWESLLFVFFLIKIVLKAGTCAAVDDWWRLAATQVCWRLQLGWLALHYHLEAPSVSK